MESKLSDCHPTGVMRNPIPSSPPHHPLWEAGKRASHLLHQVVWKSSDPDAKGDNNNTCICCFHPETQTLQAKHTHRCLEVLLEKGPSPVASASRKLSMKRMKPNLYGAQSQAFLTREMLKLM